jgi:hypothetical protein
MNLESLKIYMKAPLPLIPKVFKDDFEVRAGFMIKSEYFFY